MLEKTYTSKCINKLQNLANNGDTEAMCALAILIEKNYGDSAYAEKLYEKAANLNDPNAMGKLGLHQMEFGLQYYKQTFKKDGLELIKKGLANLKKAALLCDDDAQEILNLLATVTKQDPQK